MEINKVCRRDIVSFVKEIEQYPCLYDKTSPDYANKVHNRRAWSVIAKKIDTTIPDCRDKWRKIRISYMRSLKQQHSDKPPMRAYYLSEYLQFLRPFLGINTKTSNQKVQEIEYDADLKKHDSSECDSSDLSDIVLDEDAHEDESVTFKNTNSIQKENPKEINYINQNEKKHFVEEKQYLINNFGDEKSFIRNGCRDEKPHIRNSYNDDIEANPRKMFLLSLLSDIDCFTETEMRIFRREVIGVCDNIISKRSIRSGY